MVFSFLRTVTFLKMANTLCIKETYRMSVHVNFGEIYVKLYLDYFLTLVSNTAVMQCG
jgi:hypothetical protein